MTPRLSSEEKWARKVARFWARTDRRTGCWIYTGTRQGRYGFVYANGRSGRGASAHRFAWELTHGPIPEGKHVLHRCDVGFCVNPAHLFLGTHAENMADMKAKGRAKTRRGEKNGRARLTDAQAAEIRALYEAKAGSHRSLGKRFGVDAKTVQNIVHGRRHGSSPAKTVHAVS